VKALRKPAAKKQAYVATLKKMYDRPEWETVRASIHNHFNQGRHLNRRDIFKNMRSAALAEWRQLAA
jgi:putative transposase